MTTLNPRGLKEKGFSTDYKKFWTRNRLRFNSNPRTPICGQPMLCEFRGHEDLTFEMSLKVDREVSTDALRCLDFPQEGFLPSKSYLNLSVSNQSKHYL